MSFKLLAIRPLEGTDPSLLKGLKPNCIYRLYNEYDYLYEEEQKDVSYIEYQEQYLNNVTNDKDGYLKLENKPIKAIKYNKQLPNDFFGENINVSAIVGENGSGKSSLLELYYYCLYLIFEENNNEKLSTKDKMSNIEIYIKNKNEIICYSFRSTEHDNYDPQEKYYDGPIIEYYQCKEVFTMNSDKNRYCRILEPEYNNYKVDFTTHVLNYSLYGLNSGYTSWLASFFYKNMFESPLIISPLRDDGNVDVNYEERKSQANLIQYVYGFQQTLLLDNIQIVEYNTIIDFKSVLYQSDISVFDLYISLNGKINEGGKNIFLINSLLNLLENTATEEMCLEIALELNSIYQESEKSDGLYRYFVTNFSKKGNIIIKSICFFYVLRLFYNLVRKDDYYKEYRFLFEKNIFLYSIKDNFLISDIDKKNIENKFVDNANVLSYDIFREIIGMYSSIYENNDFFTLIHDKGQYVNLNKYVEYFLSLYGDFKDLELEFEDILQIIKERFIKEYSEGNNSFYLWVLDDLLKQINLIDKENTIELKSVIHYFNTDLFEFIEPINYRVNNPEQFELRINSDYFVNVNKIEDIPIYFFKYDIKVVKTNIKNIDEINSLIKSSVLIPFLYNSLSSGEQHMINSIVQICGYIVSCQKLKTKKESIDYYNLIFDELEVYLHPEFQRRYLKNLLTVLGVLTKNIFFRSNSSKKINFNILLSTHSPFILSDIPSQNVLKLKEGKPVKSVKGYEVNSFGANIHDLLADEFFLENGFMGEFAKEKIKECIALLNWKILSNDFNRLLQEEWKRKQNREEFKRDKNKLIDFYNSNSCSIMYFVKKNAKELDVFSNVKNEIIELWRDKKEIESLSEQFIKKDVNFLEFIDTQKSNIFQLINTIGENLISNQLIEMYNDAFDISNIVDKLERLKKERERLDREIEKLDRLDYV